MTKSKKPKKPATATLCLEVAYDPDRTDPESLASALDRLMKTALSIPGVMDDYGQTKFGPCMVSSVHTDERPRDLPKGNPNGE